MKIKYETIERDIQEAHDYLTKLLRKVKKKAIDDGELLPELEHICMHINAAYNKQYLTLDQVLRKSKTKKDWDQFATPQELIIDYGKKRVVSTENSTAENPEHFQKCRVEK